MRRLVPSRGINASYCVASTLCTQERTWRECHAEGITREAYAALDYHAACTFGVHSVSRHLWGCSCRYHAEGHAVVGNAPETYFRAAYITPLVYSGLWPLRRLHFRCAFGITRAAGLAV